MPLRRLPLVLAATRLVSGSSTKFASRGAERDSVRIVSTVTLVEVGPVLVVFRVLSRLDASGVPAVPCVRRLAF